MYVPLATYCVLVLATVVAAAPAEKSFLAQNATASIASGAAGSSASVRDAQRHLVALAGDGVDAALTQQVTAAGMAAPIEAANMTMKYDGIPADLVHHNGKTITSDWRGEVPGYPEYNQSHSGATQRPLRVPTDAGLLAAAALVAFLHTAA